MHQSCSSFKVFRQLLPGPAAHRSRHEQKGNDRFLIASHRKFADYEVRSAAEGMPENLYTYRPSEGKFKSEKPAFGSSEMRTFSEQAKHVACANFAFAAEFDGQQPPAVCDKGGPDPAKTKRELLIYLRNSFAAISKSFQAIKPENQFDPIEGPYASPNTRLGLAVVIWHNADHYGQMVVYLRLNGIVPPPSRPNPPPVKDTY